MGGGGGGGGTANLVYSRAEMQKEITISQAVKRPAVVTMKRKTNKRGNVRITSHVLPSFNIQEQGRRERVRAPVRGKKSPPPTKGRSAKYVYTKSERLTLSRRVTWDCSERVNLYIDK